jgi:hypothetical protein
MKLRSKCRNVFNPHSSNATSRTSDMGEEEQNASTYPICLTFPALASNNFSILAHVSLNVGDWSGATDSPVRMLIACGGGGSRKGRKVREAKKEESWRRRDGLGASA